MYFVFTLQYVPFCKNVILSYIYIYISNVCVGVIVLQIEPQYYMHYIQPTVIDMRITILLVLAILTWANYDINNPRIHIIPVLWPI